MKSLLKGGFLKTFPDFYHLDRYRDEIVQMEGFGEKSYGKMIASVEKKPQYHICKVCSCDGYSYDWKDGGQGIRTAFPRRSAGICESSGGLLRFYIPSGFRGYHVPEHLGLVP